MALLALPGSACLWVTSAAAERTADLRVALHSYRGGPGWIRVNLKANPPPPLPCSPQSLGAAVPPKPC